MKILMVITKITNIYKIYNVLVLILLILFMYLFNINNIILILIFVFLECSNDIELLVSCSHNANTNAKYCVVCCFDVLVKYNLYTNAYPSLFVAYKLMLTLSVTQVGCERSFSKLKYIKNYLRNTLSQDILESFMLMNVEKDLLNTIDSNDVINKLAARNSTFKNLLLL